MEMERVCVYAVVVDNNQQRMAYTADIASHEASIAE
jgi:hypothetical protein